MFSWLGMGNAPRGPGEVSDTLPPANTSPFLFQETSTPANRLRVIDIAFDVARVDLPVEGARHSRKIWNHVDELRIDSELVARLARNGLRVGVALPDAWPAIRAIVAAAGAEVRRDRLVAQRAVPLTIKLSSIEETESVFSYERNGRLVGKTFTEGDKLLNLDYVFHPELGGSTDLTLTLEIRHDQSAMTWQKQDGILRQVPAYDRHVFSDLSVLLTLHTDESLVVGLSDQSDNEYLLGSRFLTFERLDKRYETVLCVTPRPFQTQGVQRGL